MFSMILHFFTIVWALMKVTKSEICDNAMALFQADGFEAVSVEVICKACNVTRGSFYHHFNNKYDVLIYWERRHAEDRLQHLHHMAEANPVIRLDNYLTAYATEISAIGCDLLYRLMLATIESGGAEQNSHTGLGTYIGSDALVGLIIDATQTSQNKAEELLRHYNLAMTGLAFEWKLSEGGFDFPAQAHMIAQTVFGLQ